MTATNQSEEEGPRKRLKFRSYKPQDDSLQGQQIDPAVASSIESTVSGIVEQAKNRPTDIDLNTLAPRKANWDLKRDVEKKLGKLEKRTKRAMAEMIREKLRADKDISQLPGTQEDAEDSD